MLNEHESLTVRTNNEKIRDLNFTLAIAYNNGAIEYEHLGKIQLALDFFLNAAIISEKCCGKEDDRTRQFYRRYNDLKEKQSKIKVSS